MLRYLLFNDQSVFLVAPAGSVREHVGYYAQLAEAPVFKKQRPHIVAKRHNGDHPVIPLLALEGSPMILAHFFLEALP